jgi:hypothetical protein
MAYSPRTSRHGGKSRGCSSNQSKPVGGRSETSLAMVVRAIATAREKMAMLLLNPKTYDSPEAFRSLLPYHGSQKTPAHATAAAGSVMSLAACRQLRTRPILFGAGFADPVAASFQLVRVPGIDSTS